MQYADFMAFPFPQHELIERRGKLEISPDILLDVCQTTSVPPHMKTMDEIVRGHAWFVGLLGKQSDPTKFGCFFGLQHPPENASVSDLVILKGMGIRFMTLAYEGKNEYGGGFATPDEPLSKKGKELIRAMAETGMVLDLSRSGHRTARDAISFVRQKSLGMRVVATHTACFDLYNHERNLPDDVLCGIRDLDGLVGLVTISWMLHETDNSIKPFLTHLNHLVELIGYENVCLGTDGVYQHLNPQEGQTRFEIMEAKLNPRGTFRARYPEQAPELNCANRLAVISGRLISRGWLPDKIMGRNLLQFFSKL